MNDKEYKELMLELFSTLLDIYDVKTSIIILYQVSKLKGCKI